MEFSVWPSLEFQAFTAVEDPAVEFGAIMEDDDAPFDVLLRAGALCTMAGRYEQAADVWSVGIDRTRRALAYAAAIVGAPQDLVPRRSAMLASLYFCLGEVYEHMGRPERALEVFRDGMRWGKDARCTMKVGLYAKCAGDHDEAVHAYVTALSREPDGGDAEYLFGDLLEARGGAGDADRAFALYSLAADKGQPRAIARLRAIGF